MKTIHPLWLVLLLSSLRYFVYAGVAFAIFYVWKPKTWRTRKIQTRGPSARTIQGEIAYSTCTALIFGLVIYTLLFSPVRQYTRVYADIHAHSIFYLVFSILTAILLHDTYFYWTHRFMHLKWVFPHVHHIHHRSHNPTPWAAYAFHPLEALVEVGILPLLLFMLPLHPVALSVFGFYMILMNVMGHLGYELYPHRFMQNGILRRLFNTSTHHNMHHHYTRCNYGLYFNIWDRLMRTNHDGYEKTFLSITSKNQYS